MPVSLEAIQQIIGKEQQIPEGFLTAKQWCLELGETKDQMNKILGKLNESGCLESQFIQIKNITGRKSSVPAYKINLPEKRGKK